MSIWAKLFGNKEKQAETEFRDLLEGLEAKRKSASTGKTESEKVALAHAFARDSTNAALTIRRKYGLSEGQTEQIVEKVLKNF